MHRALKATVAIAALWSAGQATPVLAQETDLQSSNVVIAYEPPSNPNYQGVADRLKGRQVLEELRQFMAPLRLPRPLSIKTAQCGTTNAWYEPQGGVVICYEFVDWMERLAPVDNLPTGMTRQDAIVGPFVQVVFHELGHAVFDILRVPIIGREEDAADQFAGFIMLQFGKEMARRTLLGAAYFWQAGSTNWSHIEFADVHGNPIQRSYNYLCMAYGGYPDEFQDIVDSGLLPRSRAVHCAHEYKVLKAAFVQTVYPYIDQDLLKIVQSRQWLKPDDGMAQ
jgi:Putative metallopeptidase